MFAAWATFLIVLVLASLAATPASAADPACPPIATTPTAQEVAAAVQKARDRGALWTIEKDGRQSWLYGTMHLGNLATAWPGPRVLDALRTADVVAVEVDITDPAIRQALTAPQDAARMPVLTPALLERMKAQARRACVPWERLSSLPPILATAALALADARWEGLDPEYSSEQVFISFARLTRKQVRGLETAADQRRELFGPSPEEQLVSIDGTLTALEEDRSRLMFRALATVWGTGDLAALTRVDEWCGCAPTPEQKARLEKVLFKSDRNPGLAAAIDALHQGHRVFAAVGIAHMVGPEGLPKRLEALGFRVQRVPFD